MSSICLIIFPAPEMQRAGSALCEHAWRSYSVTKTWWEMALSSGDKSHSRLILLSLQLHLHMQKPSGELILG